MMLTNSLLGVFIFCVAFAGAQYRNVYNFKIASWNTNGDRWQSVKHLMDTEAIDVMGVQEAGKEPTRTSTISTGILPRVYIIGEMDGGLRKFEMPMNELGLSEMKLDNTYYLYYFDRTCQTLGRAQSKKQNIALVSRERAAEILFFPPETGQETRNMAEAEYDQRLFINRPTVGIRIDNSIFFTLHTEPTRRNEAQLIINQINQFMNQNYPQSTWILMGDFNRKPETILTTKLGYNMQPLIIIPPGATHKTNVLDFGIFGGPDQQASMMGSMRVKLLPWLNGGVGREIASDHTPIEFYMV